ATSRGLRRPPQPRARAAPRAGAARLRGRGSGPRRAQAGSARAENTPVMAALPLVLIVDDSARNRKLARDVLQLARFRTLEAAKAGIALARNSPRQQGASTPGHVQAGTVGARSTSAYVRTADAAHRPRLATTNDRRRFSRCRIDSVSPCSSPCLASQHSRA